MSLPEEKLAEFRNRKVGFVFQFHHLLPEFDARENVMLPCLIAGMGRDAARKRAEDLLSEVGLAERFPHRIGELSGGELQRVAICRALAMGPEILLADEPTGNLDKETAGSVVGLLGDLNRSKGLSLVIVTHNEELAGKMHRVLKIDDGRIDGFLPSPLWLSWRSRCSFPRLSARKASPYWRSGWRGRTVWEPTRSAASWGPAWARNSTPPGSART
jgi:lipoprotein-releasing system ATP-binding protein